MISFEWITIVVQLITVITDKRMSEISHITLESRIAPNGMQIT